MPDRMVVIEHRDGRQYAVRPADFRKEYEPQGFKALRYEDGSEYEAPKSADDSELVGAGLDATTAGRLEAAGFRSLSALSKATDEDLLAINGIGRATVDKIRGLAEPSEPSE